VNPPSSGWPLYSVIVDYNCKSVKKTSADGRYTLGKKGNFVVEKQIGLLRSNLVQVQNSRME
jgi:hypothetical protein